MGKEEIHSMLEIESPKEFFISLNRDNLVVVDFYATYCQPCMQIMKILPRLEAALREGIGLVKVDVEKCPSIKEMYKVVKVPTFLFFKRGQEVARLEGVHTFKKIEDLAHSLLDVL
jgi:thiol-disulfide isomerase/thioredoxin